jgi:hypothetical protein
MLRNIVRLTSLVYNITEGGFIERHGCCSMKYSVFMMLLIAIASLVGISSVYLQAEAEMQLLQLQQPPPLPPSGLPPIDLPGLPPIPPPSSQLQSSGGSTIR